MFCETVLCLLMLQSPDTQRLILTSPYMTMPSYLNPTVQVPPLLNPGVHDHLRYLDRLEQQEFDSYFEEFDLND